MLHEVNICSSTLVTDSKSIFVVSSTEERGKLIRIVHPLSKVGIIDIIDENEILLDMTIKEFNWSFEIFNIQNYSFV